MSSPATSSLLRGIEHKIIIKSESSEYEKRFMGKNYVQAKQTGISLTTEGYSVYFDYS